MKREYELAEHRKNENPLSALRADHPVRRMIHRFRMIGSHAQSSTVNPTGTGTGANGNANGSAASSAIDLQYSPINHIKSLSLADTRDLVYMSDQVADPTDRQTESRGTENDSVISTKLDGITSKWGKRIGLQRSSVAIDVTEQESHDDKVSDEASKADVGPRISRWAGLKKPATINKPIKKKQDGFVLPSQNVIYEAVVQKNKKPDSFTITEDRFQRLESANSTILNRLVLMQAELTKELGDLTDRMNQMDEKIVELLTVAKQSKNREIHSLYQVRERNDSVSDDFFSADTLSSWARDDCSPRHVTCRSEKNVRNHSTSNRVYPIQSDQSSSHSSSARTRNARELANGERATHANSLGRVHIGNLFANTEKYRSTKPMTIGLLNFQRLPPRVSPLVVGGQSVEPYCDQSSFEITNPMESRSTATESVSSPRSSRGSIGVCDSRKISFVNPSFPRLITHQECNSNPDQGGTGSIVPRTDYTDVGFRSIYNTPYPYNVQNNTRIPKRLTASQLSCPSSDNFETQTRPILTPTFYHQDHPLSDRPISLRPISPSVDLPGPKNQGIELPRLEELCSQTRSKTSVRMAPRATSDSSISSSDQSGNTKQNSTKQTFLLL